MEKKFRLLLLLVLLLTAATGAWAGEEPQLLTTINASINFMSGSKTFDDKVTVTFSDYVYYSDENGWYADASLLTVAGTNGYTITSCKFYTESGDAETGYTIEGVSPSVYLSDGSVFTDANQSVEIGIPGVKKIEVYGTAPSASASSDAKHLITATYDKQTRSLEQPLPYATTIGELYEAVTGESFSDLLTTMTAMNMPLTGIGSNNTSVVSIGELNGASTPVTVNADGKATVGLNFSGYVRGSYVSVTPPLYVTMKDGVKDADKWTVKVGDGQAQALPIGGLTGDGSETVTLQYNGRLKVKGVKATSDAAPAKTPATVTTAPTGAAIVGVGKTTALVSGGAAEGGTMMYAVTTENTKPASTDGFSDAVPTAQTITASGTVYVWYYVKGDETHSDSEIAATAIEVPVADIVWDATNVFNSSHQDDMANTFIPNPLTYEGITISVSGEEGSNFIAYDPLYQTGLLVCYGDEGDSFTFTAPSGMKFCKIEIIINESYDFDDYGEWTSDETGKKFVWSGTAANAVTLGTVYTAASNLNSIAFYLSK